VIRTIRTACRTAVLGAAALTAGLAGTGPAAHAAAAAPQWVPAFGYQFFSNTGGPGVSGQPFWQKSDSPLGYAQASQTLGSNGVNLSVSPDSTPPYNGSAGSGVIVPLGTVASSHLLDSFGNLTEPAITGSQNLTVRIIFDTNGDGTYFEWNSSGVFVSTGGDGNWFVAPGSPVPASAVQAFENPAEGPNTPIWAWIQLEDFTPGTTATGNVYSVAGQPLTTQAYAAPVTGLKATAKYTNLTAAWNPSTGATGYQVTVTTHRGTVIVASATVTGTSYTRGGLKETTGYAVHVLAEPAAPGQQPATAYVTTK
jgi:hypothetical protein